MERNTKSLVWGIVIIIVGLLFLGNNLDIWGFNLFFDGWWTVFIIVPSVISLFYNEDVMPSVLGIIIGVLLLMAAQDFIGWSMVGKIFMPFLIICIGISILAKPNFKFLRKSKSGSNEYLGIFGGIEEKINDKFVGGRCVAIFGGVDIDLTEADITEDIVIDSVSIFGGVSIKLPKGSVVKTNGLSLFGGTENKFKDKPTKKSPIIYVNHISIFGGTELK